MRFTYGSLWVLLSHLALERQDAFSLTNGQRHRPVGMLGALLQGWLSHPPARLTWGPAHPSAPSQPRPRWGCPGVSTQLIIHRGSALKPIWNQPPRAASWPPQPWSHFVLALRFQFSLSHESNSGSIGVLKICMWQDLSTLVHFIITGERFRKYSFQHEQSSKEGS